MLRSMLLVLVSATVTLAVEPSRTVTTAQRQEYRETYYRGGRQPIIYFGVRTTMTDRGCRIDFVQTNSPAWIAGLEVGDYITHVDGYQVGIVDDLSYPFWSELRRAANKKLMIDGMDGKNKTPFHFTVKWDEE